MPFAYTNPKEEHLNTRRFGGLFDVSHMGQLRLRGGESLSLLEKLLPTHIQRLQEGKAQYSALLNHQGGIIDDIIVYCLKFKKDYLLCVNAGPVEKVFRWIQKKTGAYKVNLTDETDQWSLIAVQGPKALGLCEQVFQTSFAGLKRFGFQEIGGRLFSRTGYTGEDGLEVYLPPHQTPLIWQELLTKGEVCSVCPVGLAARNTLRLEMAYLLSGQDFDESRTLKAAGLGRLQKNPTEYIGKRASLIDNGETLRGFMMEDSPGVPRQGYSVFSATGELIGRVTSGAKSPNLEKMIGLAYIKGVREEIFVEIHGQKVKARLFKGPFLSESVREKSAGN